MVKADFRALALVATILALGAFFGFVGGRAIGDMTLLPYVSDTDQRPEIELPAELKAGVLTSMRVDEEALQGILSALSAQDYAAAAKLADQRGTEANKPSRQLSARVSPHWKSTEREMRRNFDEFAVQLRQNAPMESLLAQNARIMNACVACHQAYHIVLPKPI